MIWKKNIGGRRFCSNYLGRNVHGKSIVRVPFFVLSFSNRGKESRV
jgi:hypothetical protein